MSTRLSVPIFCLIKTLKRFQDCPPAVWEIWPSWYSQSYVYVYFAASLILRYQWVNCFDIGYKFFYILRTRKWEENVDRFGDVTHLLSSKFFFWTSFRCWGSFVICVFWIWSSSGANKLVFETITVVLSKNITPIKFNILLSLRGVSL